ncbi:unnamed protein product [Prorocentrum cordatum]|uniref:Uncharacterized protein n=1 Tax=Prorocentrum cordatum TaxID=2364126 RepID=A0ABN9V126_9DINO|nr:unnamed protein product [Polarella glacialis]
MDELAISGAKSHTASEEQVSFVRGAVRILKMLLTYGAHFEVWFYKLGESRIDDAFPEQVEGNPISPKMRLLLMSRCCRGLGVFRSTRCWSTLWAERRTRSSSAPSVASTQTQAARRIDT